MATKKTINAQLRDRALVHAINLARYSNAEVRAMLRVLNAADADLFARMMVALERVPASSFSVKRLDAALSGVWSMNERLYRQLATRSDAALRELTAAELDWHRETFRALLPEGAPRAGVPAAEQVWAAARAQPFRGRVNAEWWASLGAGRARRIQDTLRNGYVRGATIDELIREVRGTRAQNYADGIIQIDRRHAESVVRTSISHAAAAARGSFYERNSDLIKEEQWVSTLDNRTTDLCMARDGKRYTAGDHRPIGHQLKWEEGPGAIHWNCRSISIPVIDAASALGLDLPPLERAAMNGVAAPGTTYKEWLAEQPANIQDHVLGKTRGALLRAGKLPFDRFFNDAGALLTLAELRAAERGLFD